MTMPKLLGLEPKVYLPVAGVAIIGVGLYYRHQRNLADEQGLVDPEAPGTYPDYGSTYLSPPTSGVGAGGYGGTGTTGGPSLQDILDLLERMNPPVTPTPAPPVVPTPNPGPGAPEPPTPTPAPAPAPIQPPVRSAPPAPSPKPPPCPQGSGCHGPGVIVNPPPPAPAHCPPSFPLGWPDCYKIACASGHGSKKKGRWHLHQNGREVWVAPVC